MSAETQAVVVRWAQAWFKVKEAEAKAARDAERKRKSGNKFRSSR